MKITATDAGPIRGLEFELSGPGVYVLRGPNGCGKSTLLDAVDAAAGKGDRKPTKRDGAALGRVEVAGVVLKLGAKVTKTGSLEVQSVEGQSALGTLIDPGYKDETVADQHRIEALLALVGAKSDPQAFAALDREAGEIIQCLPIQTSAVAAADMMRKALHDRALTAERDAERFAGQEQAARAAAEGVDISAPCDDAELQTAFQWAALEQSRLTTAAKAGLKARQDAQAARQRLASVEDGDSLASATIACAKARECMEHTNEVIADLKWSLEKAQSDLREENARHASEVKSLANATERASLREQLESVISAGESAEVPTTAEIEAAQLAVDASRNSLQMAALVRKAREQVANANGFADATKQQATRAERLRKAAWAVDGVLADQIAQLGVPVSIREGRMVVERNGREVFIGDLSHGERAALFLGPLSRSLGKGGLATVDQSTWESLDGEARSAIAAESARLGIYILTAESEKNAAECARPIRVEQYAGQKA